MTAPCLSLFRSPWSLLLSCLLFLDATSAAATQCSSDGREEVRRAILEITDPAPPFLQQQSHAPFAGCFQRGKETQAIADIQAAIYAAEEAPGRQKLPIVLVPGYLGTDSFDFLVTHVDYWFGIIGALREAGFTRVYAADIDPVGYSSNGPIEGSAVLDDRIEAVAEGYNGRSCQLKLIVEAVLEAAGAEQVNLIGHSQGALTARWMISNLGMADKVNAFVSVGGAHRGVPLVDLAIGPYALPAWMINAVEKITTWFLGSLCHGSEATSALGSHVEMWPPYTEQFFNPNCLDADSVQYFSVAARMQDRSDTEFGPYLLSEFWLVHVLYDWMDVGPNDGLIPVRSAKGPAKRERWVHLGELVGKKVIPGTGIESSSAGVYWGVDHGAFMNFPLGLTKYYHFDVERFYVDLARMLNAYSD